MATRLATLKPLGFLAGTSAALLQGMTHRPHPLHDTQHTTLAHAIRACERAGFTHRPHTSEAPELVFVQGPCFLLVTPGHNGQPSEIHFGTDTKGVFPC